jgi:thiamine-monophosphate kinase
MQPELDGHEYVVGRQLKPEARLDVLEQLEGLHVLPTSMIDVSDGIASDLRQLTYASGLGCRLYEDKLPIDPGTKQLCQEFGIDPTVAALNGGEDYELLFTVSQEDFSKIEHHPDFSIIGHMMPETAIQEVVTKAGNVHPLMAQGW